MTPIPEAAVEAGRVVSKLDKKLRKCRDIIETTLNDSTLWQPSRRSVEWVQRYIIEAMDLLDVLPAPHPPAPDAAVEAAVLAEREECARIIEQYCLMDSGGEKFLRPRSDGDVNGLAYADAIRARSAVPKPPAPRRVWTSPPMAVRGDEEVLIVTSLSDPYNPTITVRPATPLPDEDEGE